MAVEGTTNEVSVEASADLSGDQFRGMVINTPGEQLARSGAGVPIAGVLQDKPNLLGRAGHIKVGGLTKASAGAALVSGARVMSDANGQFITATATNVPVGVAFSAAGAAGELFTMLVTPGGAPI